MDKNFMKLAKSFERPALSLEKTHKRTFTKIGGKLTAPHGFVAPSLPFLMQIDFAEINKKGTLADFPQHGLLFLFADAEKVNSSLTLTSGKQFQFVFCDVDAKGLEAVEMQNAFPEIFLKTKLVSSLPNYDQTDELAEAFDNLSYDDQDKYTDKTFVSGEFGMIGGWPEIFQSSFLAPNEVLLLQIGSFDEISWGDDGLLQFYISTEDLKNKNFDQAKANLETT